MNKKMQNALDTLKEINFRESAFQKEEPITDYYREELDLLQQALTELSAYQELGTVEELRTLVAPKEVKISELLEYEKEANNLKCLNCKRKEMCIKNSLSCSEYFLVEKLGYKIIDDLEEE